MVRVESWHKRKIIHPLLTTNIQCVYVLYDAHTHTNTHPFILYIRMHIHFNQVIVCCDGHTHTHTHWSGWKLYYYWKSVSHFETIKIEHHSWVNKTNNVNKKPNLPNGFSNKWEQTNNGNTKLWQRCDQCADFKKAFIHSVAVVGTLRTALDYIELCTEDEEENEIDTENNK